MQNCAGYLFAHFSMHRKRFQPYSIGSPRMEQTIYITRSNTVFASNLSVFLESTRTKCYSGMKIAHITHTNSKTRRLITDHVAKSHAYICRNMRVAPTHHPIRREATSVFAGNPYPTDRTQSYADARN